MLLACSDNVSTWHTLTTIQASLLQRRMALARGKDFPINLVIFYSETADGWHQESACITRCWPSLRGVLREYGVKASCNHHVVQGKATAATNEGKSAIGLKANNSMRFTRKPAKQQSFRRNLGKKLIFLFLSTLNFLLAAKGWDPE